MAVTGNLFPFIQQHVPDGLPALSFLQERFTDLADWRAEARDYLHSLLMFTPEPIDLNPELVDHTEYADYTQQKWYFTASAGDRVPLILLRPRVLERQLPTIVALHDRDGIYYFGKKKLVEEEGEPQRLVAFRELYYDGTALANALARRGYLVAITDSFYFGERRISVPPPPEMQSDFLLATEGSDPWLALLDDLAGRREALVAKSLLLAGLSWPGILAWDDQRTVDFLLTLPEVDPARIGCVGFDMGGLRSLLLGALDPRVRAVCVVGWMSTQAEMLEEEAAQYAWGDLVPGLLRVLDWPDIAALHAPDPLLVMQGSRDANFPLKGYQKAAERLRAIYAKAGAPGELDIGLFDQPHLFSLDMQQHAWAFFENTLGSQP